LFLLSPSAWIPAVCVIVTYNRFVSWDSISVSSTNLLTEYNEDSFTLISISGINHWLPQQCTFKSAFQRVLPFRLLSWCLLYLKASMTLAILSRNHCEHENQNGCLGICFIDNKL
jgi:hypothetical protein